MKKLTLFFLVFALCFCTFFNAYSININGYDEGAEWNGAEAQMILQGESNCKVNFGLIKWIVDKEINTVYLCIMFKEPDLLTDNINVGVSLQIENTEPFVVTVQTSPNQVDVDKYYIDGAVSVDNTNGVTCEIRLGMKFGLPAVLNGKLRFYDSDGAPSNVYDFSIETPEINTTETTSETTSEHTDKKTTSKRTTKSTTKKMTTVKSDKKEDDSGVLSSSKTSAESSSRTTKTNTTKKTSNKNESKTRKSKATNISETTAAEIMQTDVSVTQQTAAQTEVQTEVKSNLAKGNIYKTITLVAGGISLVAISVLGTIKSKKENNNENSRNS